MYLITEIITFVYAVRGQPHYANSLISLQSQGNALKVKLGFHFATPTCSLNDTQMGVPNAWQRDHYIHCWPAVTPKDVISTKLMAISPLHYNT